VVIEILDSAGLLLLLAVLVLAALLARRALLRRRGARLNCALRIDAARPGHGWHLGVVRFSRVHLQWFGIFSAAHQAKYAFVRRSIEVLERRDPRGFELHSIPQGAIVAQCKALTSDGREVEFELAMGPAALTGLLVWLESAPPGTHQRSGVRRS
jgi:hypothetical protein